MADAKPPSHAAADKKKSSPGTYTNKTTVKHDEKKEENFLEKTAHTLRDKVLEFTEEVKEKAHHLTHSDDSKKGEKPGSKLKTSPKPGAKDSSSGDDHPSKLPPPPSSFSTIDKKDGAAAPSSSKPPGGASTSKASGLPAGGGAKPPGANLGSKATVPPSGGDSKPPGGKKDEEAAKPPSGDQKDTDAPSSSKSAEGMKLGRSGAQKPPNTSGEADTSTKPLSEQHTDDGVHVSFAGVKTVDDLLQQIDDAVENAKIVIDNGGKKRAAKNVAAPDAKDPQRKLHKEEPIRIVYGDIHTIEDLLVLVNNQPGHRNIVLEGAPGQTSTISMQKPKNTPADADKKDVSRAKTTETPSGTTTTKKTETADGTALEKKSETPLSSTTVEKTVKTTGKPLAAGDTSFPQTDQIHVNIQNIESVDDLLDRVDDAVENVPVAIDTTSRDDKISTPAGSYKGKSEEGDSQKRQGHRRQNATAAVKLPQQKPEDNGVDDSETERF